MFCFAWVDASETTFEPTVHAREDEAIFGFKVEQAEGEFASLSLEIRNPRIGLLVPTRKVWCWLSWQKNSEVVPLFFGRLVAVPDDLHLEVVTLAFTARPADYGARKFALANSLRGPPFYDPVFIEAEKRADPDVVLEARAELWHIDRTTHAVTTSDVLVGEDGNEDFLASEVPYASVSVRLNQPPLRSVSIDGVVNWTQAGKGAFDVKRNAHFLTYTGDGLISDWPKTGASLGGGWEVVDGRAADAAGIERFPDDYFQIAGSFSAQFPDDWLAVKTIHWEFVTAKKEEAVLVPLWDVVGTLRLGYDVERQYKEHVRFTLHANVQPIVTLPSDDEVLAISVNGSDVGLPIDNQIPIGDVRRRQYFPTERGLQSVEYLIALARAHLLVRSRAVEVTFQCRFERAINLTLRKNARIHDGRLPGGNALGKIIRYSFSADGDSGELIGEVTIGCAIGYGGAVADVAGDPTYVDQGYVAPGYQEYAGKLVVLGPGDVGYGPPGGPPDDDGLDLLRGIRKADVVSNELTANLYQQQKDIVAGAAAIGLDTRQVGDVIRARLGVVGTRVHFRLKPIEGGPFESTYDIDVSDLEVPAMINLEAA